MSIIHKVILLFKQKLYTYAHPMASIGTGVIFYYCVGSTVHLLLQKRANKPGLKHPGQIGVIGGYNDLHVIERPDGQLSFETPSQAIWREIAEEAGETFRSRLTQSDFELDKVVKMQPNLESNYLGDGSKQVNLHMLWVCRITKEIAQLAEVHDPVESDSIEVITLDDIHHPDIVPKLVPWLSPVVSELSCKDVL